ncbi:MAG: CD1871A family CXXC motif-containing protein [Lachnospiraceae bacterium]
MDSMINVRNMIRFLGITIALMLITLGIWTGGYQDILNKATHICLECIGIG